MKKLTSNEILVKAVTLLLTFITFFLQCSCKCKSGAELSYVPVQVSSFSKSYEPETTRPATILISPSNIDPPSQATIVDSENTGNNLKSGFIYLDELIPEIKVELMYFSLDNFTGRAVDGYEVNRCIITYKAGLALKKAQDILGEQGLGLIIYDAYRPQRSVDSFCDWASDPSDITMKEKYYPNIDKEDIIPSGFIATKSSHTRGSTVDLSIVRLEDGESLDMGGIFDFFGEISAYNASGLTQEQHANRNLLKTTMEQCGFRYYSKEWWHFRLTDEPFPDTYFDFPVK
ncbi:MAG: M15 family metallopeptidase [Eubacteriales bacterium]|nr:M15 family metallopeptidase [Eubacteriales bacterium]